jgi:hypothetical protein
VDFGFAPGGDGYFQSMQAMFGRRSSTSLIAKQGVTAIRQFIGHLDATTSITKPVGDLLVGSHANEEGQLFIHSFAGQQGPTLFETLEETLSDTTKSIAIPDTLIGHNAGDPITHAFHIKGCNIGKAEPFLLKLKESLGQNVQVTAPLFFHGLTSVSTHGVFEYLGYEFLLRRRDPFPDRRTALTVFDAEQFKLIDGSVVPTADWNPLVPPNPNVTRKQSVPATLGVSLINRTTIPTPRQYRAIEIPFVWRVTFPDVASVPTNEADQRQVLRSTLLADSRLQDAHPYPQWRREGFGSFDEFFAGYRWRCQQRGRTLICTGKRFLYVVMVAITDPARTPPSGFFGNGPLLFNLYPAPGSGLASMTTALQVTDATFFATV